MLRLRATGCVTNSIVLVQTSHYKNTLSLQFFSIAYQQEHLTIFLCKWRRTKITICLCNTYQDNLWFLLKDCICLRPYTNTKKKRNNVGTNPTIENIMHIDWKYRNQLLRTCRTQINCIDFTSIGFDSCTYCNTK